MNEGGAYEAPHLTKDIFTVDGAVDDLLASGRKRMGFFMRYGTQ